MKQVKILFEKCKKKMPHRPPDEIDFGLGFRSALGWMLEEIEKLGYGDCIEDNINQELQ